MKKFTFFLTAALLLTINATAANRFGSFDVPGDFYSTNLLESMTPQSVFVVNTVGDQPDALPGDGFCNDGNGNCSLRGAIQETNAFPGANIIDFDIPGGCFQAIEPQTALPDINDTVTIDGYSQTGALPNTAATGSNANLCITLDGSNIPSGFVDGLRINAPNTVVRGLAVRGWTDAGIEVVTGNGSVIEGNFIGTDIFGTSASANRIGVLVFANNVRIGGTTLISRNIVAGNTRFGIALTEPASGGLVQNNQVGLGANSLPLGNGESGISIFRSAGNTIGGTTSTVRNIISGNGTLATGGLDGSGVSVFGDLIGNSPNNLIQGNYIGTDPTGAAALPNAVNGVRIFGAINTTVGGTTAAARNVLSGNTLNGVRIEGAGATGNLIQGNYIGLSASGTADLGNVRDGVQVLGVAGNTVGGTAAGAGNYISGNNGDGVLLNGGGTTNNFVQGNFVGTNAAGTAAVPNGFSGIELLVVPAGNTVGGATPGARNYVAGNTFFGIVLAGATGSVVQGNNVGISAAGATFSNSTGVYVQDSANNTIGGITAGAGNLISGNTGFGIRMVQFTTGFPVTGNLVQGNQIGTNAAGTAAVPNNIGVLVQVANANTVGGTIPEARNLISGNTTSGIDILNANDNLVQGNYVGTTLDGSAALANGGNGVHIGTSGGGVSLNNTIGGTANGAGNLISGNSLAGVRIAGNSDANLVQGNTVGLNTAGNALPNGTSGVIVSDSTASGNVIGGNAPGAGNVLSGNSFNGVLITTGASGNNVAGNRIGTNAAGTHARPNTGNGVHIISAASNTVGGPDSSYRNLISGNLAGGIRISGAGATGNTIAANYVGSNAAGNNYLLTADGTNPTSNLVYGILIETPNNTIGGATVDARNLISGQFASFVPGIRILGGGTGTIVRNNYIGTTADGSVVLFNGQGIECIASGFTFDSNLISGSFFGVNIGAVTSGFITNNLFGTTAGGAATLGNGFSIYLNASSGVKVGEDSGGQPAPNVIAGGSRKGITVFGNGTGNLFRQNSIYNNAELGIDLGDDGVTQNDAGDTDLANNFQNFPVISQITTNIEGTLNSTPNRSFRIEFYNSPSADPTGYGEGRSFITNTVVTTDGSGNASFSVANPIPVGGFISATATDLATSDTSEFSAYKQVLAPTAVKFAGARAVKFEDGALVEWQTGFEADNLGFNVYRESKGRRELVNDALVSGSALLTQSRLESGFDYRWFDPNGTNDSVYFIEAVDLDGSSELFGAFAIVQNMRGRWNKSNSKTLSELNQPAAPKTLAVEPRAARRVNPEPAQIIAQNQLSEIDGVRLAVRNAGFYRVPAAALLANGLAPTADPNNLALFADGIEQPINLVLSETGAFEAVEFYGTGIDSTETDLRSYELVVLPGPGRRLEKIGSQGVPSEAQSYPASVERRDRTNYFSGLLNDAEENFFGAIVGSTGVDQTLEISNLAPEAQTAALSVKLQGLTRSAHTVRVELNGQFLGSIDFEAMLKGTFERQIPSNMLLDGVNTVRLAALGGAGDLSLVENIRLDFPRKFRAVNNSLAFSAESGRETFVEGFTNSAVRVFDVTDADDVYEIAPRIKKGRVFLPVPTAKQAVEAEKEADESEAGTSRSFTFGVTPTGGGTRNLLAVVEASEVAAVERNFASGLRKIKGAPMLIITRREFFAPAERLAALRRSEGLNVLSVDVQDVYDEFGFGQKSTQAVKEFLRFAQTNYQIKPQYVLLAGDATYDPKRYLGGNADLVPTRLVDTLTMETASDEWFGDFANDGTAEFAIGRLPASDAVELNAMVEKLIAYENQTPAGSLTFVADVSDGFDFAGANAAVREILPGGLNATDLRRGDASDAAVRSGILNAFNSGQKIISYVGHGSTGIWRGNVFTKSDAANLTNADHLPVLVTMTCLNGFFHDAVNTNLGETLLKNPSGGAVAVWTSTSAGLPDSYGSLNVELHRQLLQGATLGQAHLQAKRAISNQDVLKTWVLLGDPSMRLR
jgi:CSLREA domain-containing protein